MGECIPMEYPDFEELKRRAVHNVGLYKDVSRQPVNKNRFRRIGKTDLAEYVTFNYENDVPFYVCPGIIEGRTNELIEAARQNNITNSDCVDINRFEKVMSVSTFKRQAMSALLDTRFNITIQHYFGSGIVYAVPVLPYRTYITNDTHMRDKIFSEKDKFYAETGDVIKMLEESDDKSQRFCCSYTYDTDTRELKIDKLHFIPED